MRTSTFALVFGILYLLVGFLGLIPALLAPPALDAPSTRFTPLYGYLLGLFPVNLLHTGVHLAVGIWGLAAWSGVASAVLFARGLAIVFGVLAVMGLVPGLNTVFGLIPLHGHDVWLHGGTAAIAAYFGWRSRAVQADRRRNATDRRQHTAAVARERRSAIGDRRRDYMPA